jgi:hypothetical protein
LNRNHLTPVACALSQSFDLLIVVILFFLQGSTLGGVVVPFGLALDRVGFVLLLIFVLVSSVSLLRRESSASDTVPGTA